MDNTPNPPEPQQQPTAQWQPMSAQPTKQSIFQRVTRAEWAIAAVIAVVIACGSCGIGRGLASSAGSSANTGQSGQSTVHVTNTPKVTATATHVPVWTTVKTFKGNGIKTTDTFDAPSTWKLVWSCDPKSFSFGQYNVIVTLYSSDGTEQDIPVNTICKSGNTGDTTVEHTDPGQYYLNVNSEAAWTIKVQVLK